MPLAVTFLEQDKQAPAQIAGQLAEFLNAAKTSLHIAIYDFRLSDVTAGAVVNALRSRAAAGVDVRIVYDAGKLQVGFPESGADPAPPGTADFVQRIGDKVQSKRITGGDPQMPKFLYSVIFIVIIMAIGGVFGVMNAMFAAVSQRTKDIGVLRILGYTPLQVLMSFFLESLLLAVLGGLLGIAIGSLCHGFTASSIAGSGAGGGKSVVLKLVVDQYILATGLGFALVMGALGGLIPALSAMRLKPLESLR